jgi:hypothetical protein
VHVVLRPMTEDGYQIYLREHEEEDARDRMITDRESFEDVLYRLRNTLNRKFLGGYGGSSAL